MTNEQVEAGGDDTSVAPPAKKSSGKKKAAENNNLTAEVTSPSRTPSKNKKTTATPNTKKRKFDDGIEAGEEDVIVNGAKGDNKDHGVEAGQGGENTPV